MANEAGPSFLEGLRDTLLTNDGDLIPRAGVGQSEAGSVGSLWIKRNRILTDAAEDDSSSLAPCEVSCNYAESTPEKCWAAVLGKVENLDGFYAERSKAYLRLTEECAGATAGHTDKVAECTGLKAAHAGKKADCDEAQFEAEVGLRCLTCTTWTPGPWSKTVENQPTAGVRVIII